MAIGLLLLLTCVVYWPGLSGAFLFDDISNLAVLGYYGRIDNWEALWLYLLSGFSGPTGRPVSTLSFLLDARNWPADPWPFKRTNLIVHLLTGLALYGFVRQVTRAMDLESRHAIQVALLTTALWLLHPLWVSTTLYAVQRMAQLSTLFVLLGLWLYVRTRLKYPPALSAGVLLNSATAIGLLGLLAILSKENGVLLPLLAITVEITVLAAYERRHKRTATRAFLWWRAFLLGVPVAALALYMAQGLPALFSADPGIRSFTPGERLLGQGLILWEYLRHIFIPRPYPGGLFNDHISVPGDPASILLALVAWATLLGLTVFAFLWRTRWPALALAVLFFMAGHLLESTFLQLELYFEHRNYLPAALLGLPVAMFLVQSRWPASSTRLAIAVGLVLTLSTLTYMRADLWGKPFQQALKWSQVNPQSARAQHYLAGRWLETGNLEEAIRLNDRAMELAPDGLPWMLQRVVLDCRLGLDPSTSIAHIEQSLTHGPRLGVGAREQLTQFVDFMLVGHCHGHTGPGQGLELIDRLGTLPGIPPTFTTALHQRAGHAHLMLGEPEQAFQRFRESLTSTPDTGILLANAALLASYDAYQLALSLLDMDVESSRTPGTRWSIDGLRRQYILQSGYYEREKASLRQRILEDMSNLSIEATP